ncbi:MAG: hypothetical protein KDJ65_26935 [Anaerolineae bacterium]|nr:hypothetical protein [Anaerolineae bacterium]
MPNRYNLKNIRMFLTEGFSDSELRSFCFDHPEFEPVYHQLSESSGKSEIVRHLVEHAYGKELFDFLLAWAEEKNSSKYKKHQPYSTPDSSISNDDYKSDKRTNDNLIESVITSPAPLFDLGEFMGSGGAIKI